MDKTLYLRCQKCKFLDIVFKDKAKEWKCPKCEFESKDLGITQIQLSKEEFEKRMKNFPVVKYDFDKTKEYKRPSHDVLNDLFGLDK